MKHLKSFKQINESIGVLGAVLVSLALFKILHSIFAKNSVFNSLSKRKGFDELEKLTKRYKDSKELVGDVIDNDDFTQIIYRYGHADNVVSIRVYWKEMKLKFKWDFEMPLFPYMKYASDDSIEVDINEEESEKLRKIIDNLKGEKFSDRDDSGWGKKWDKESRSGWKPGIKNPL